MRVEAACLRLQEGCKPIEQIVKAVGFTDPERMRRAFVRLHGYSPQHARHESRMDS
ncbi:helix-turn-helix domain-containing protein [Pseudomonas sp. SH1-B]